jgi:hypothetical protein
LIAAVEIEIEIEMDPVYYQVALESQKQWQDEHPDYQKQPSLALALDSSIIRAAHRQNRHFRKHEVMFLADDDLIVKTLDVAPTRSISVILSEPEGAQIATNFGLIPA